MHQLLREPRYREAARRLRLEMELLPPVEAAVESLKRLARTKAPVTFV